MREIRILEGTRVRLRDTIDFSSFYNGYACSGNEGWVRKRRQDNMGFTQVYIEWDKDNWSYNGAPDGWTWEDHFDIIEEPPMEENSTNPGDALKRAFSDFIDTVSGQQPEKPVVVSEPDGPNPEMVKEVMDSERALAQKEALDLMNNAESFIVVTVQRHDHPEYKDGVLAPHLRTFYGSHETQIMLNLQFAGLATKAHHDLAAHVISDILGKED